MPALDVPVNPLFAANTSAASYEGGAAYSDYSDGYAGNGRIETEDYGTASSDYLNDSSYATTPAPENNPKAASAPAYTKSTGEEHSPIITPRKRRSFLNSAGRQGCLYRHSHRPAQASHAFEKNAAAAAPPTIGNPAKKEDDNQYLDINTLKGDPNDGDDE